MNIIKFYNSLDTLNLIIFWGIIIIIFLLIIFLILIITKKNKKETIPEENQEPEITLPIKENITLTYQDIKIDKPLTKEESFEDNFFNNEPTKELAEIHTKEDIKEEKFNVLEYIPNLEEKQENTIKEEKQDFKENSSPKIEIPIERKPYQKNVLREMSLNQTSPIGIIRENEREKQKETELTKDLTTSLNNYEPQQEEIKEEPREYLKEVSKKLSSASELDEIKRTEYELQQEEEAIISYEELMQKKDSIKMIDEEEAVISIEELIAKKKQEEKLYQLTEKEENTNFIKELKNFRNDL